MILLMPVCHQICYWACATLYNGLLLVAQKPVKRNGEKGESEPENKRNCLDSEGRHFERWTRCNKHSVFVQL